MTRTISRSRWAAVGAAVAITLGAGGVGITQATTSSGPRAIYEAIQPCRLADLRPAPDTVGPRPTPLGSNETLTLDGWGAVGNCDLATGTTALSLNVTALGATQPTFIQLFPAGTTRPDQGSNLNPVPGQPPTPNAVNVTLNDDGEFSVYNLQGDVNIIIDVVGVFEGHDHDDRYYTKAQVDALHRPTEVLLTAADFSSVSDATTVGQTVVYSSGGTASQCALAVFTVPSRSTADNVRLVYSAQDSAAAYDITARVILQNFANAAGTYPGTSGLDPRHEATSIPVPPSASNDTFDEMNVPIPDLPLGRGGDLPTLGVCFENIAAGQAVYLVSATVEL